MIIAHVIGADEIEDGEGRVVGVQATLRVYFADLDSSKDLVEITRHIGQGAVGVSIEDGDGRPVLELAKPKPRGRRAKGQKDRLVEGGLVEDGQGSGE
jgi:hypothetical protein